MRGLITRNTFLLNSVSGQADSWNDANALAGNFNQLKELKAKYPNLKILILLVAGHCLASSPLQLNQPIFRVL